MAGQRVSTNCVLWLVAIAGLLAVDSGKAQPPGSTSSPAPTLPTAQQGIPTTPPAPILGSGSSGPQSVMPQKDVMSGPGPQSGLQPAPRRFSFKIDPKTATKDLLPKPPVVPAAGPIVADDLLKVREVEFQARPEKSTPTEKLTELTAHQLAKINHMNAKKADAFMAALAANRADLAGLPFAMGDECRTVGERTKQFTIAVSTVRQALGGNQIFLTNLGGRQLGGPGFGISGGLPQISPGATPQPSAPQQLVTINGPFWTQYRTLCEQEDSARSTPDKNLCEHVTLARIAALMQMLAPESAEMRLGLVKYLTAVPHVEATRALARLAIFSSEENVRLAAIESLKVRREKDYTDILVKGLRYPWPAVAKRSADAIARIGRPDLVPELVAVLAEADPRLPVTKEVDGKTVAVVREMVKVNHHRNCMMCHAPGNPETVSGNAITAEVPIQGQPLPSPAEGYRQTSPDIMIRIDVTYLRQDFSALLPVAEAHPWPDMQRFDFLLRERKLTSEEADDYREKLTPKEEGVFSPYQRAALSALRELTGKDTAPTAAAWRKLLTLPTKAEVKSDVVEKAPR